MDRGHTDQAEVPRKKELHIQVTELEGRVNDLTKAIEDQQALSGGLASRIEILEVEVGVR